MPQVRLEFEELEIHRVKKRWRFYFIIVTEHPTEPDKWLLTSMPDPPFKLARRHQNEYSFVPEGEAADGLIVLEREMPVDRSLQVRAYLRHSRKGVRSVGEVLENVQGGLTGQAFDIVTNIMGGSQPWLVIAKSAVKLVGGILKKLPDRDFGMINLDEVFGDEFEEQTELDRKQDFTGEASLTWTWSVVE